MTGETRVLYVAEIVGKCGVFCAKRLLPQLKRRFSVDFVVANADGATGGAGLGKNHAGYLRKIGCNVLTTGDCAFFKKDLVSSLSEMNCVLRPANLPNGAPGRGWKLCKNSEGKSLCVISLLGQAEFLRAHASSPFDALDGILAKIPSDCKNVVVDFHACATAEKQAFARFADGKVSAVFGSHGRIQTADERIFAGGTAGITDCGRTGAVDGVSGFSPSSKIVEFLTGIPQWSCEFDPALCRRQELQGVFVRIGADGTALSVERIKERLEDV